MINNFDKNYAFLSNFYDAPVIYEGITYLNSEAAFQAAKTLDLKERQKFSTLNPSQAKKAGRKLDLREDWEKVKNQVMYDVCYAKFSSNTHLKLLLIATKDEELVEGNWWHDNYWGDCSCDKCKDTIGRNELGRILMQIRDNLKKENNYAHV